MTFLRQSTASQEIPLGRFVDSTDGNTEETALTIANTDIKLWKTGATTLASKNSGGATHIANGEYYCVLDATDTDTIGPLKVTVHVSGALGVQAWFNVLDEAVYDALFGTTALATATNITAATGIDVTKVNGGAITGTGTPEVDLSAAALADVNAEVVDCLNVDTYAEPGQETPAATNTLVKKIGYLFKAWRNKKTSDGTTEKLFNDDAATVDQKRTVSEAGGTVTKAEIATGP